LVAGACSYVNAFIEKPSRARAKRGEEGGEEGGNDEDGEGDMSTSDDEDEDESYGQSAKVGGHTSYIL
jgi:hypothetical protein